jgi:hypothetical protein
MISSVSELLAVLREGEAPRDVYRGRSPGGFWVTYGGGNVAPAVVDEAVKRGQIAETWPGEGFEYWRLPEFVGVKPKHLKHRSRVG